jgi:hypothetical protein
MDPDVNLREQREVGARLAADAHPGAQDYLADVDRLVELTAAMDAWLSRGGSLPGEWKRERAGSDQYETWMETTAYKGVEE